MIVHAIIDAIIISFWCAVALEFARVVVRIFKRARYNHRYKKFHKEYDKYRR